LTKQTAFYKHTGLAGAPSHVDDKWGVDVDDMYETDAILPAFDLEQFSIQMEPATNRTTDPVTLGYITFDKLSRLI
jgi:hypothetical protein